MAEKSTPGSSWCAALMAIRECIGYCVALACDMSDTGGVLRYGSEVSLLSSRPGIRNLSKGKSKGLMVGERCEIAALQEITEMSHCQVKGEQLAVKGTVLPLCRSELTAKECQWLP